MHYKKYSKLDRVLASGDAEDTAKIILAAPGKPVVDVEINSNDAYSDYKLKVLGSRGTYKTDVRHYDMKYIIDGENPEQPETSEPLTNSEGLPTYYVYAMFTFGYNGNRRQKNRFMVC